MKSFTIRQLVKAVGGNYFGDEAALDREIQFVTSDSREAAPGALFVAFVGARTDGHRYMTRCLKDGAVCCLSEREPAEDERPCVQVPSTLRAMGALAAWHRSRFHIPVIGITGSVGKTTTKEMVASVLSERFNTHKTQKNFNNELGVPQTLLRLDDANEVSVVEMGISDFGEMRRLTAMVHPTIAVMSVIGDSHLEFLHDHAGVLRAKGEIFESMGPDDLAILNGDDETLRAYYPPTRRLTYGLQDGNDFVAANVENLGAQGVRCTIRHAGGEFDVHIPAYGVHMVYAALAGAAVGHSLGMTDEEIARGIAHYQTVGDRARVLHTPKLTIVSDCYNANPSSTAAAIESLRLLDGRKVCVLGDMLELGENTAALHRQVGERAAQAGVELVLCTGELSRSICEGARSAGGTALWFPDKDALISALPETIRMGDCILVKASHSMAFEDVTKALLEL